MMCTKIYTMNIADSTLKLTDSLSPNTADADTDGI